jgi:hypothetical protein
MQKLFFVKELGDKVTVDYFKSKEAIINERDRDDPYR